MKKNIFQTLLVLAFLFISGFSLSQAVACPSAWSNTTPAVFEGNWSVTAPIVFEYTDAVTGCHCTVVTTACYRLNLASGLHEISIDRIELRNLSNCPPEIFDNTRLTDAIIIRAFANKDILKMLNLTEIPFCPTQMCLLKIYDRICHNGWIINGSSAVMNVCYDIPEQKIIFPRSCSETIYVCIDPVTLQPQITKYGYPTGPECPEGCSADCHVQ